VKIEQEVPNEFVLVLDDRGTDSDLKTVSSRSDQEFPRREKGAFYKNIERKMILKKKRVNVSNWHCNLARHLKDTTSCSRLTRHITTSGRLSR
jgi:hypothetical protein